MPDSGVLENGTQFWMTLVLVIVVAVVATLIGIGVGVAADKSVGPRFPCASTQLWDGDTCYDRTDHAGHEGG